ncbi:tRNA uridine-5-carboxymethylaminomethyl(34) synthesis GTPase MnmE [Desulfocurvibacter africanus]|uniref:tRNA uridine-5-carboxymethylaminomethyl(34) synthesis GTPase MnmE n=1 Tax=Desulfocurvibacter africanus TaxID=873 RepID=UPI00041A7561|nr:tRNA uridine-5-carboxymethylaminomethyl(34) synthesis GTPase MnmE [Desulfocurvibacter africanus]
MRHDTDTQDIQDTIAAIATPPGQGGVGIVRLSGSDARRIGLALFRATSPAFRDFTPRMLHHGAILDAQGSPIDEALAVLMPGPRSYTGEDVLELHCHGSSAVLREVLDATLALGARLAERGEFTRRAFLNGRLDLSQAEAVAELIAAPDRAAAHLARTRLAGLLGERVRALRTRLEHLRAALCVAVDFPEDEVDCLAPEDFLSGVRAVMAEVRGLLTSHERTRAFREGAVVVLAGPVNAGKSSLLNALLGRERAIVSDTPGTTRDWLEESISLDGLPVRLVDTAGLRETADAVELEGVRRSRELLERADLVLLVLDGGQPADPAALALAHEVGPQRLLLVLNKIDLAPELPDEPGEGIALPRPHPPGADAPLDPRTPGADRPECVEGRPVLAAEDMKMGGDRGELFPPAAGGILPLPALPVSARTGAGIEALTATLRRRLAEAAGGEPQAGELAPNVRQAQAMCQALDELEALALDIEAAVPYDLLSVRLETACMRLGEITGEIAPQDVLNAVFDTFCIGK